MTAEQLRTERMRIFTEMRGIISGAREAGRLLNDAETERKETLERELTEKEGLLALAEREEQLDRSLAEMTAKRNEHVERATGAKDPAAEYDRIFRKYLRSGMSLMRPDETAVLMNQQVQDEDVQRQMAALRDQGIASGAAGGFTVPQGFWAKVTETQKAFSGMLQTANNLNTATGQSIPWPTNDDTGNEGEILGENVATTVLDLTFGVKTLGAFMFTSRMVRASYQLLQDSGIDVESFIAKKIGQRLARRLNRALTVGVGTTEPLGLIPGAPVGQTFTMSAGKLTLSFAGAWKDLVTLEHRVDAAYRQGGACRFMLNDTALGQLQTLEDSTGAPLWVPSIRDGVPGLILGYPYTVNNHMASPAVNAITVAFGDFSEGYVARNVQGGSLLRLSERYAEALQVAFIGFERHDGTVDDTASYAVLKHPAS